MVGYVEGEDRYWFFQIRESKRLKNIKLSIHTTLTELIITNATNDYGKEGTKNDI